MSLDVINSKTKIGGQRASKRKEENTEYPTWKEKTDPVKCSIHVTSASEKKGKNVELKQYSKK